MENLDSMFKPKSIAIVGASRDPHSIGFSVVKNLIDSKYGGKIFPVNPKADEILDLKCYHSVLEIPEEIDLAVITVPAAITPNVVEECGKKGVKGLAIIASGFSEVGRTDLEDKVVEIARKYNMRILGPNIVGIMSNPMKMNASFGPYLPYPGKITMISQSGALLIALDSRTWVDRVGMSYLISIGNMSDLDFADLIDYFKNDEDTKCISLYVEGIKNGRKFIDVCKKILEKPIVALKSGVSARGSIAAASHTGSLAGSGKVYSAAFKQATVVQAYTLDDLFDRSLALSLQPPMKGENLLIITNGGGVGVLATDAAEKYGIPLKDPPEDLKEKLKQIMPEFGSAKNPVDITGMASAEWYGKALKIALQHPWVNGVTVLYCETSVSDPRELSMEIFEATNCNRVDKPITVSYIGGEVTERAIEWLQKKGIPVFRSPDRAISAMAALREYGRFIEKGFDEFYRFEDVDTEAVRSILKKIKNEGRDYVTEVEAKAILEAYRIPVAKTMLAKTKEEAEELSKNMKYPLVAKIVSPQVIHKSDVGGVILNIKTPEELVNAFEKIILNVKTKVPNAEIIGVAVQEMAPQGTESIIGSTKDVQFGPTVMFGLGGIFVEVMKDVSFRIAPFSKSTAIDMINELNGKAILYGVRGEKPKDIESLSDAISRVSQLVTDFPEIKELDANPTLVYEEGIKVVDARIILEK
ncbi:MAG: acetate--CoA ligase family protein [Thermoplasmata archaeon]|nr:acetate--CoA ligase family protein [Thermoplasmata archaeon]MVT13250.1 CoA-binding protein [Euryarchaeota archaeon]